MRLWIGQKRLLLTLSKKKEEKYKEIFKIIDRRWDCQLHRPLHAAGYFLNPSLYYKDPNVEDCQEVINGLYSCIGKLVVTEEEQLRIHTELPLYRHAEGVFGNIMAKKMRGQLAPGIFFIYIF
jgi:hypothetical protein